MSNLNSPEAGSVPEMIAEIGREQKCPELIYNAYTSQYDILCLLCLILLLARAHISQ